MKRRKSEICCGLFCTFSCKLFYMIKHDCTTIKKNLGTKKQLPSCIRLCYLLIISIQNIFITKTSFYNNESTFSIRLTVSSLPIKKAISNTAGPYFPPTNIMRIGSCNSPGLMLRTSANSLKEDSIF